MVQELYITPEIQKQTSPQSPSKKQDEQPKGFLSGIFNKKKN